MSQAILKGRLDGIQRNRLKSLFDMFYTPKELASEIGVTIDQIYNVYIPLDCPHERDVRNRILINGKIFARWYGEVYPKILLLEDETFCKTCKKGVKIYKPKEKRLGTLIYVLSVCQNCGRKLTKILSDKRAK